MAHLSRRASFFIWLLDMGWAGATLPASSSCTVTGHGNMRCGVQCTTRPDQKSKIRAPADLYVCKTPCSTQNWYVDRASCGSCSTVSINSVHDTEALE